GLAWPGGAVPRWGTVHLATRDIGTGEPCQPGAADDREHVRSGFLTFGAIRGVPVVFLARHGYGHTIPPHQVNYRANLWALKEQGAGDIVSVVSVGGIRTDLGPGRIVVPHQVIDYTCGRMNTFFENEAPVKHIDFTEPYTDELRNRLLAAAKACGEAAVDGAVYAATQGPSLE